jgi:hypothetical protein
MSKKIYTGAMRVWFLLLTATLGCAQTNVIDGPSQIQISNSSVEAAISKQGYVSGVAGGSFLDRKTGFRDAGFGLDIVDWLMEPGSDESYRDQLTGDLRYEFNNLVHGKIAKRSIEGPQICTKAGRVEPIIIRGTEFIAIKMQHRYTIAAPGRKTGSEWEQTIVFPEGARYFISSDRIKTVNKSPAMFLRLDMPGHIKHDRGNTFSEVFLSYAGRIPASEFSGDFAPDEKFLYRRGKKPPPKRFIRAYRLRNPKTGAPGPWLAGMTLQPDMVSEAWCHQRSYVCMIQEIGGRPVNPGDTFSAAFVVGFFDSIEEMEAIYDKYSGATGLQVSSSGWKLLK